MHEEWGPKKNQRSPYNIALLKLPKQSQKPIPNVLFDHFNLDNGQKLMAVGWGPSGDGPALGADIFGSLRMEPQMFIDSLQCNRIWDGSIGDHLACGLNEAHKASCIGQ